VPWRAKPGKSAKSLKTMHYLLAYVPEKSDQCDHAGRRRVRRTNMKCFTIENETNNITLHGSAKEAEAVPDSERFGTEATLGKLAANWPAARLVEVYNSLPGVTEVKKFKDRATAVNRIWRAIQTLGQTEPVAAEPAATPVGEPQEAAETTQPEAEVPANAEPATDTPAAPQTPDVAPEAAPAKTKVARAKKAPKPATEPGTPRENSKTSQVIAMLKAEGGTTLEEIMTRMGWLKHTTRAMLSAGGSLTKKHGLVVLSEKVGETRRYSIKG
jgi:outer membrane biosynthesis protein TonB